MMVGLEAFAIINILFMIVFFIVSVSFMLIIPLGLYYLVRKEHDQPEEMKRENAEQIARQDARKKP